MSLTAGVDEAGRGPLAGPVTAAAVILDERSPIAGLTDSKKLSASERERLAGCIRSQALAWSVVCASEAEIDEINILHASMLAMQRAVEALDVRPSLVLVDGNRCPRIDCDVRAIVKGDLLEPCISAASILAKVHRDQIMLELDARFPEYGFRQHKGYPTRQHLEALAEHGPCEVHRMTFGPVKRVIAR